jgi:hypothetical protein
MTKVARQPLAFGMTRWGPLPGTTDLYLFWGGPGDGIYLHKGEQGAHIRVRHETASGIYGTVRAAQRAVDAFTAAGEETS